MLNFHERFFVKSLLDVYKYLKDYDREENPYRIGALEYVVNASKGINKTDVCSHTKCKSNYGGSSIKTLYHNHDIHYSCHRLKTYKISPIIGAHHLLSLFKVKKGNNVSNCMDDHSKTNIFTHIPPK